MRYAITSLLLFALLPAFGQSNNQQGTAIRNLKAYSPPALSLASNVTAKTTGINIRTDRATAKADVWIKRDNKTGVYSIHVGDSLTIYYRGVIDSLQLKGRFHNVNF